VPSLSVYWSQIGTRLLAGQARAEDAADAAAAQQLEDQGFSPDPDPDPASEKAAGAPLKTLHVGGSVKPPVLLHAENPAFNNAARGMRYSGKVEVYLWVDETGSPSHLMVKKAAGLGLDEQALAAVAAYKFKPATRDGKPVKVELYVDVNFQIF
jgi:TonB family protein